MEIQLEELKQKVLQGYKVNKQEALALAELPLEELCGAADEIRQRFCGNIFDLCTIINGKSGKCSENCKYCAQSSFYHTNVESYPLLGTEELLRQAQYNSDRGVLRYSIVTSGKKLSGKEVEQACDSIRVIKKKCGYFCLCVFWSVGGGSISESKSGRGGAGT